MNKNLQSLMQKEMTRREFIATLGFGIATIMGMGTLLKLLGKHNPIERHLTSTTGVSTAYGSSVYGGMKR